MHIYKFVYIFLYMFTVIHADMCIASMWEEGAIFSISQEKQVKNVLPEILM